MTMASETRGSGALQLNSVHCASITSSRSMSLTGRPCFPASRLTRFSGAWSCGFRAAGGSGEASRLFDRQVSRRPRHDRGVRWSQGARRTCTPAPRHHEAIHGSRGPLRQETQSRQQRIQLRRTTSPFDGAASANPLLGLSVKLPDTRSKCGDLVAIVGPGEPPQCASLLCRSCRTAPRLAIRRDLHLSERGHQQVRRAARYVAAPPASAIRNSLTLLRAPKPSRRLNALPGPTAASRQRSTNGTQTHGCLIRRMVLSTYAPANVGRMIPAYYMTKIAGVAPDAACPVTYWNSFLERVTGGDAELIAFLHRVVGYALTGVTREHALFFLYGTGANGKTTFLNAITGAMGDYCRIAPIETFTASISERHPTDLAGLRGARLVTAVETEEGRRWAESKIKALTGGDKISARFMRQDFFEFTPQFKLLIAGNHKPGLRSVDEAIRRRFYLIPFTVTIPAAERDPELLEKLKTERPGILHWMIEGCLQWQRHGLAPPTVVTAATAAYLEAEDAIAAWIADCCEIDPNHWEGRNDLFASWSAWAQKAGEYTGSLKRFLERLETRPGIVPKRHSYGRGFYGLRLRPAW